MSEHSDGTVLVHQDLVTFSATDGLVPRYVTFDPDADPLIRTVPHYGIEVPNVVLLGIDALSHHLVSAIGNMSDRHDYGARIQVVKFEATITNTVAPRRLHWSLNGGERTRFHWRGGRGRFSVGRYIGGTTSRRNQKD